ncbi:MAG: hypothetical protein V2B20_21620 [Pseudomonadota bacterium]
MKIREMAKEMVAMWTWLYKHPAHDREYYVTHVAKMTDPWKNLCPLCDLESSGNKCTNCLMIDEDQKSTFCDDLESPLRKWNATSFNNPDNRTYYAGEVIAIAGKLVKRAHASV